MKLENYGKYVAVVAIGKGNCRVKEQRRRTNKNNEEKKEIYYWKTKTNSKSPIEECLKVVS
jgi:hypothetical protein